MPTNTSLGCFLLFLAITFSFRLSCFFQEEFFDLIVNTVLNHEWFLMCGCQFPLFAALRIVWSNHYVLIPLNPNSPMLSKRQQVSRESAPSFRNPCRLNFTPQWLAGNA